MMIQAPQVCSCPVTFRPFTTDMEVGAGHDGASLVEPPVEKILCCSVLASEECTSIFRHPIFAYEEALPWPPASWRDIACWYCAHRFETPPVPLPVRYEARTDTYHVSGIYCSWNCAKAELRDRCGMAYGDKAVMLENLARTRFNFEGPSISPAPPRTRLKLFAGPEGMSIEDFRKDSAVSFTSLLEPPLLSFPQIYERHTLEDGFAPWSIKGIRANRAISTTEAQTSPAHVGGNNLYSAFLKAKRETTGASSSAPSSSSTVAAKAPSFPTTSEAPEGISAQPASLRQWIRPAMT